MNLDVVLIDTISPDGGMSTFRITPKLAHQRVLIDRYRDIQPDHFGDEIDIGGTRVYNSAECSLVRADSRLRAFHQQDHGFSFQFEHMGVPVGPTREGHAGQYNLVLPIGFRLTDFRIVDPYDTKHDDVRQKKLFQYSVVWDKECRVQLVEMTLRSNRGSFSFIVHGSATLVDAESTQEFVKADESEWRVSSLTNHYMLKEEGKRVLATELGRKLDWLHLKPNILEIGLNLNAILTSCHEAFKKKTAKE